MNDYNPRQKVSESEIEQCLGKDTYEIPYRDPEYLMGSKIKNLYANIITPSYAHGYSLGIEYMNNWFERGFEKDYFKSIYIDGKHVIDDYKKFSRLNVKGENPRARIAPMVEYDFDREGLDFYMGPPNVYFRRSRIEEAFFKDYDNNLYLGMVPRLMRMNFNIKVRVNSRSQQLDVFNKMEMNFRVGATQSEYISVDFHIPKSIILHIANKAGFKIFNGEILEIVEFLQYMNAHSEVPFLFKLRAINQKPEFFMRIDELYTHIINKDKLQLDDGERDGKLDFNFHVEMNPILEMPIPYYYAFYSGEDFLSSIDAQAIKDEKMQVPLYSINLIEIPKTDEHGWNIACDTDYLCDDGDTYIDISELFNGNNILNKSITHDLTLGVNPSRYINIKIYRDKDIARKVDFTIDWNEKKIMFKSPESENMLHIAIYVDRAYINELEINMKDYHNKRLTIDEEGQTIETYKSSKDKKEKVTTIRDVK